MPAERRWNAPRKPLNVYSKKRLHTAEMPKTPVDEIDDNDHTDELPVLVETVVLDPARATLIDTDSLDSLEDTAERTARFHLDPAANEVEVESLQSDLAARSQQIAALEQDIARLNARWSDVERHLTAKDARIEDLSRVISELRRTLADRQTAEQRLAAELQERNSALDRLSTENFELRAAVATAAEQKPAFAAETTAPPVMPGDTASVQRLSEEIASLAAYIENRRHWWQELKQQTAASSAQVDRLQREIESLEAARREAAALADRESGRATMLRRELVEQARLVEELRRALAAGRTATAATPAQVAQQAPARAVAEPAPRAAAPPLEAPAKRFVHRPSAADAAETTAAAVGLPPTPAFEVLAALEAEVGHKRQQIAAQLVELRERDRRIEESAAALDRLREELAAMRTDFEHHRADRARLERALVDKDRALEARDARIATLQDELHERLGAVQKLNAMDLSLQGLDSKMSDRLRRADQTAETSSSPTLVCLTGDAPKQFALMSKTVTIGRGHDCDIQIMTHFVSREHARITTDRGAVMIEDLASTNGVFVNSIRIDRHELRHGDLVTIGETQFRFLESVAH
jgi:septal ring factor EnvC (AmiA/AmiB activator)